MMIQGLYVFQGLAAGFTTPQGNSTMACMATIKQRPGGMWEYRRRVPDWLRNILGQKEFRRSLRTKDKAEAKRRVVSFIAEIDLLFANASQTVTLDHQRINALSAVWLAAQVEAGKAEPPDEATIDAHLDALESATEGRRLYPEGSQQEASEQRASMIALMSPTVDSLLIEKGLPNLDQASREKLALELFGDSATYWQTMVRFRLGNYRAVPGLADRPAWVSPVLASADSEDDRQLAFVYPQVLRVPRS
ncbi:MAG: hypothetical protein Q8M37_01675 [Nevskia sp.]|nr:hypothetical protein [Nevskia sp.]